MRKCPICGGFNFKHHLSNKKPLPLYEKSVVCLHCETIVYIRETVIAYRKFDPEKNKVIKVFLNTGIRQ
jgi:hypothetical protein